MAALIRHVVGDLGGRGPLGPFYPGRFFSRDGWADGSRELFATILSTLVLALFFVERTGFVVNDVADGIAVALFFAFGLLTSWVCEITHRRGRRLQAQEQDLRAGRELLAGKRGALSAAHRSAARHGVDAAT